MIYRREISTNVSYEETRFFSSKYPRVNIEMNIEIKEEPPYLPDDILWDYFDYYPHKKNELKKEVESANQNPDFSWSKLGVASDFYLSHPKMTDQEVFYAFLSKTWRYVYPEKRRILQKNGVELRHFLENDLSEVEWQEIEDILKKMKTKSIGLLGVDRALLLYYISQYGKVIFWGRNEEIIFYFQFGLRSNKGRVIKMKHEIGTDIYALKYKNDFQNYIIGTIP